MSDYSKFLTANLSGDNVSPLRNKGSRWPDEFKAACVAETLEPNQTVRGVAKRHGLHPSQLSQWRGMAKRGELLLPAPEPSDEVEFAAVMMEQSVPDVPPPPTPKVATGCRHDGKLEVIYGDVSLLLPADWPVGQLAEVMSILGQRT